MIVSACIDLTQRIGGGYEGMVSFVQDRTDEKGIPQTDRAEVEKLLNPSTHGEKNQE